MSRQNRFFLENQKLFAAGALSLAAKRLELHRFDSRPQRKGTLKTYEYQAEKKCGAYSCHIISPNRIDKVKKKHEEKKGHLTKDCRSSKTPQPLGFENPWGQDVRHEL